jgi:hypothetical protein
MRCAGLDALILERTLAMGVQMFLPVGILSAVVREWLQQPRPGPAVLTGQLPWSASRAHRPASLVCQPRSQASALSLPATLATSCCTDARPEPAADMLASMRKASAWRMAATCCRSVCGTLAHGRQGLDAQPPRRLTVHAPPLPAAVLPLYYSQEAAAYDNQQRMVGYTSHMMLYTLSNVPAGSPLYWWVPWLVAGTKGPTAPWHCTQTSFHSCVDVLVATAMVCEPHHLVVLPTGSPSGSSAFGQATAAGCCCFIAR